MPEQQPPPQASPSAFVRMRGLIERAGPIRHTLRSIGKRLHPNHITALRVPGTLVAIGLDPISHVASTTAWAVTTLLDWLDGAVARSTPGMETKEGTLLDTNIDKLSNAVALGYHVARHCTDITLAISAALSVVLNAASTVQRGPGQGTAMAQGILRPDDCESVTAESSVGRIKANVWGKLKQTIECGAITALFAAGDSTAVRIMASIGLVASSLLSIVSTVQRHRTHTPKEPGAPSL